MFLHLSCHSVHGGGGAVWQASPRQTPLPETATAVLECILVSQIQFLLYETMWG